MADTLPAPPPPALVSGSNWKVFLSWDWRYQKGRQGWDESRTHRVREKGRIGLGMEPERDAERRRAREKPAETETEKERRHQSRGRENLEPEWCDEDVRTALDHPRHQHCGSPCLQHPRLPVAVTPREGLMEGLKKISQGGGSPERASKLSAKPAPLQSEPRSRKISAKKGEKGSKGKRVQVTGEDRENSLQNTERPKWARLEWKRWRHSVKPEHLCCLFLLIPV